MNAEITDNSLLEIQPIILDKIPTGDWFFFYSKNGIRSLHDQCSTDEWEALKKKDIHWAAIGEGTAAAMKDYGIGCDFIGSGEFETTSEQFLKSCSPSETVVFFRALHSKNSLFIKISKHRQSSHIAVYDNKIISKNYPPFDVGIYTSSRNAEGFFRQNKHPRLACIAIGEPTRKTLVKLQIPPHILYMASEPSESGIIGCLRELPIF